MGRNEQGAPGDEIMHEGGDRHPAQPEADKRTPVERAQVLGELVAQGDVVIAPASTVAEPDLDHVRTAEDFDTNRDLEPHHGMALSASWASPEVHDGVIGGPAPDWMVVPHYTNTENLNIDPTSDPLAVVSLGGHDQYLVEAIGRRASFRSFED
jgi:hypothetical protein